MELQLEPGVYVVAVSGGVDSMTLLNVLSKLEDLRLVVAHFDHGIRPDSLEDRLLVQSVADELGLPFVFHEGRLGEQVSEAEARQARYDFLRRVQEVAGADAIITAHHQDDALETAIHNLLRGTGRKGLSSLGSSEVVRPFLNVTKQQLLDHAREHHLRWREDSTNQDTTYTRNYIRHEIIPKLTMAQKEQLLGHIRSGQVLNQKIDELLSNQLDTHTDDAGLDRQWFTGLPHDVARETMAAWLRKQGIREFDRKLIEQLVISAKTQKTGSKANINKQYKLAISTNHLSLTGS